MSEVILCIGKLKEKYWRDAAGEYEKRLTRLTKLEIIELPDLPEPQNASDADRDKIKKKEGEAILSHLKPDDFAVALCIEAPEWSSERLASFLSGRDQGGRRTVFVIGGSLGLSEAVTRRADAKLSMSPMTFPHQLARIMLLEQLYRARKILAGERYHK